jgi:plastocyanin
MLATGETFEFTFTETGRYEYHCVPHPFMTPAVVVTN